MMTEDKVIELIRAERDRQQEKYHPDDKYHLLSVWSVILSVRLGKLNELLLDPVDSAAYKPVHKLNGYEQHDIRRRCVEIAAVATAIAELT